MFVALIEFEFLIIVLVIKFARMECLCFILALGMQAAMILKVHMLE